MRVLDGCTLRIEDPDCAVAREMMDKFDAAIIDQDPDYVNQLEIRRRTAFARKSKYSEENGGLLLIAYDVDGKPIAMGGAAMFGSDVWMGLGYVDLEYRGSGLVQ